MKPKNYIWVLELKIGSKWIPTPHSELSMGDMMHVKRNFLYNNSDKVVRVIKYEAKT